MTSERKMWTLRILEKLLVILILILVCGGVALLIFRGEISQGVLGWGVPTLSALLILLLIIQSVVDGYVSQALSYVSQSDDEKFRSLYENSPTALITVDSNGSILSFNPAAVKLLHTTMDGLSGNFYDFVVAHTGHDPSMLKGKVRSGVTIADEEVAIRTFKGDEIWTLMSVYEDKQNHHHLISLIDVTQAKKVDTAKSEFVALANHQLGTPIAAIRWHLDLLKRKMRDVATPDQEKHLLKIERNVMRMIALIDDFLSVSKLEMGTFAAEQKPINLTEYIDTILEEYEEKVTNKALKITRQESPEGYVFTTDTRLFHIIISNLVSNAVKYIKQEGNLTISYQVSGNKLVLQIADDGIGIPQKDQEKLFHKFFRASNAMLYQTEGTGLGLYVAKKSAEQLGGTIEVQSTENVQTVFTVTLPIR